jgi:hypothetical protein
MPTTTVKSSVVTAVEITGMMPGGIASVMGVSVAAPVMV